MKAVRKSQNGTQSHFKSGYFKQHRIENISIMLLILFGCLGLIFYSNVFNDCIKKNIAGQLTRDSGILPMMENTSSKLFQYGDQKASLTVNSDLEAGEQVVFVIDHFYDEARYEMDFGDGHSIVVRSRKIHHTYEQPGQYEIRLRISYKDQLMSKAKDQLFIKPTDKFSYSEE